MFATVLEEDIDETYLRKLANDIRIHIQEKILLAVVDCNKQYELPTFQILNTSAYVSSFIFTSYNQLGKMPNIHFVRYTPPGDFRYFVNVYVDLEYNVGVISNPISN